LLTEKQGRFTVFISCIDFIGKKVSGKNLLPPDPGIDIVPLFEIRIIENVSRINNASVFIGLELIGQ